MSVSIKICGLRDVENISEILALASKDVRLEYLGFILVPESKRYVPVEELTELLQIEGVAKRAVLVTRDMPLAELVSLPLSSVRGLQLHGSEEFENRKYILAIKDKYPDLLVFKAIGVSEIESFESCAQYEDLVDMFIFDTKIKTASGEVSGGTGISFDWEMLSQYTLNKPYMLSGGLDLDNLPMVHGLIAKDARLIGVDLNSKFEIEVGLKDIKKLEKSFRILKGEYEC